MRNLVAGLVIVISLGLSAWRVGSSAAENHMMSIREATTGDRSEHYVRALAEDIGPRLTGSRQLERAARWAREEMKAIGLEDARLEAWGEVAVTFEQGDSRGELAFPERRPVAFLVDAWTAGTRGPVRGPAIPAPPTMEAWEVVRASLRGAWVLVESSLPGPAQELGARYEVAGFVQRSRGEHLVSCGAMPSRREDVPAIPVVQLANHDFDDVWELARLGRTPELEFDLKHEFGAARSVHNVLGDIVGTERPDELVILGAHLDSWHIGQGATDNATGVAIVLEAARRIVASGLAPKRTIRVVLWTGEEQGLLGARAYVRDHGPELSKTSIVLNVDAGANPISGAQASVVYVEPLREAFAGFDDVTIRPARAASPPAGTPASACGPKLACAPGAADASTSACVSGATQQPKPGGAGSCDPAAACTTASTCGPASGGGAACGSDHVAFLEAGVPAIVFEQSGPLDYERSHHTPHDTMDGVVTDYLRRSAEIVGVGALHLANRRDLLPREHAQSANVTETGRLFPR